VISIVRDRRDHYPSRKSLLSYAKETLKSLASMDEQCTRLSQKDDGYPTWLDSPIVLER